jgi:alcohol dehydrogenase YqhD (iron-dependent ADH family)
VDLIKTVMHAAQALQKNGSDYNARAEMMWASSLSHNNLMNAGANRGDWACHQLEHELGGMFDVAHGAGLAAVWGSWARYVLDANPARFAQLGMMLFDLCTGSVRDIATECIEQMEAFFHSIGMPLSLKELGVNVTAEQVKELAYKCSFFGKRQIGTFRKLDRPDMEKIYTASLG